MSCQLKGRARFFIIVLKGFIVIRIDYTRASNAREHCPATIYEF